MLYIIREYKNKLVFVCLVALLGVPQVILAQTVAPQVFVQNIHVDKTTYTAGDIVSGSFTLANTGTQDESAIYYTISYVGDYQPNNLPSTIYLTSKKTGPFYIQANNQLIIPFIYTLASNVSGKSRGLEIQAYSQGGIPLGWGNVMVDVLPSKAVAISPIQVTNAQVTANGNTYGIQSGAIVQNNYPITLSATLKNTNAKTVTLVPTIEIYANSYTGNPSETFASSSISIGAGASKKFSSNLMPAGGLTPGIYVANLIFNDQTGQRISADLTQVSFTVDGEFATIEGVYTDKSYTTAGEALRLTVNYSASPSDIATGKVLTLPPADIAISIEGSVSGAVVGMIHDTINLASTSKTFAIPAQKDADQISATVSIMLGSQLLASSSVNLTPPNAPKPSRSWWNQENKTLVEALFGLVVLILLILWLLRKKSNQGLAMVALVMLTTASLFFFTQTARAATVSGVSFNATPVNVGNQFYVQGTVSDNAVQLSQSTTFAAAASYTPSGGNFPNQSDSGSQSTPGQTGLYQNLLASISIAPSSGGKSSGNGVIYLGRFPNGMYTSCTESGSAISCNGTVVRGSGASEPQGVDVALPGFVSNGLYIGNSPGPIYNWSWYDWYKYGSTSWDYSNAADAGNHFLDNTIITSGGCTESLSGQPARCPYANDLENGYSGQISISNPYLTQNTGTRSYQFSIGPFTANGSGAQTVNVSVTENGLNQYSKPLTFTLPVAQQAPGAPTGLSYSCSNNGGTVSAAWNAVSGASKYEFRIAPSTTSQQGPYVSQIVSGTATSQNIAANTSYWIDVFSISSGGTYGGFASLTNVNCPSTSPPTVAMYVNTNGQTSATINAGQSATLGWTSSNVATNGCYSDEFSYQGSNGNFPANASNGSTGTLSQTKQFRIACVGLDGSTILSNWVTVTVNPLPPTATLYVNGQSSATITSGGSATLSWISSNTVANGCTSGEFQYNGSNSGFPTSGSTSTGILTNTSTSPITKSYGFSCQGFDGTWTPDSPVYVTVNPVAVIPVLPTVTLTANPSTITAGNNTTVTLSSSNATWCGSNAMPSSYGSGATSGNFTDAPTQSIQYSITCTNANASVYASTSVTVIPANNQGGGGSCSDVGPINLNWTPVAGTTIYRINRFYTKPGQYQLIGTSNTANYTDTDVAVGAPYSYRIDAYIPANGIEQGIAYPTGSATCLTNTPPSCPAGSSWNGTSCVPSASCQAYDSSGNATTTVTLGDPVTWGLASGATAPTTGVTWTGSQLPTAGVSANSSDGVSYLINYTTIGSKTMNLNGTACSPTALTVVAKNTFGEF